MINTKAFNWPFRRKAVLIHLSSTGLLAIIVATVVFVLWFPGAYRSMSGGTELFVLVASVDFTIGPLITFVIADSRKTWKQLVRDIAVIVVLQLVALSYGLNMVSISRPVMLALEEDRFRVVAAHDVYVQELPLAKPEFRSLSLTGPRLAYSAVPTDPKEKSDALSLGMRGYDVGTRPSLWQPWDDKVRAQALAHAKPLAALMRRYPKGQAEFAAAIDKTGRPADKLVYIPTITFRDDWVTLLDATSGDVVGFAPFDGF